MGERVAGRVKDLLRIWWMAARSSTDVVVVKTAHDWATLARDIPLMMGLRVVASKRIHMSREQAEGFYAVHKERPFFGELCDFMTSGPVVVQVLEGEDAVARNRELMGATNPADAAEGTIRKTFAESIEANSVHGSDSDENAKIEIDFFFKPEEIVG